MTGTRLSYWFQDFVAALGAASGVGYLATAYTVSRWLTRRVPARPLLPPLPPEMTWEDLRCRTLDGLTLAGWMIAPPRPWATIALFHGMRRNRTQTLKRIQFLTAAGFRCVAFDHRAHGQSEGKKTSFGFFEARDVHAVLGLVAQRWPGQPCAALGISMGAAALCFAHAQTQGLQAVILESMYPDLACAFQNRVDTRYPRWFHRFKKGIIWVTERRMGIRLGQVAPIDYMEKLAPAPVLLLTGSADVLSPEEDIYKLFQRCRSSRQLRIIPGACHEDVCEKGGLLYQQIIVSFLKQHLCQVQARAA